MVVVRVQSLIWNLSQKKYKTKLEIENRVGKKEKGDNGVASWGRKIKQNSSSSCIRLSPRYWARFCKNKNVFCSERTSHLYIYRKIVYLQAVPKLKKNAKKPFQIFWNFSKNALTWH